MPKMENAGKVRQISLAQIVENGNVRNDYTGIEELAESIKINGLIEPIAVKALGKDDNGIEKYELVAGFRRRRAFQCLCDKSESFSMVDAVIVTGDKLTLQLVENLQRSDLTHTEMEAGLYKLVKSLGSNKEAAARLGKSDFFVARNITAYRVREILEKNDISTKSLSTSALNEIQSLSGDALKEIGKKLVVGGGAASLARRLVKEHEYNVYMKNHKPLIQQEDAQQDEEEIFEEDDDNTEPMESNIADTDDTIEHDEYGIEPALPVFPVKNPAAKKTESKTPVREMQEPPHKKVNLNTVQAVIQGYIDKIKSSEAGYEYQYKTDAAYEIWALLLAELAGP